MSWEENQGAQPKTLSIKTAQEKGYKYRTLILENLW